MTLKPLIPAAFLAALAPGIAGAEAWLFDPAGSAVSFAIGQGDDVVAGSLPVKRADICFDERDLEATRAAFVFDMAAATTGIAERDLIMLAPEWLAAADWPEAEFVLERFARLGPNTYQGGGALTIKGTTKSIAFPLTLNLIDDTAKGDLTIDRRDFTIGEGRWGESEKWVAFPIHITFSVTANPTGEPCETE